MGDIKFRGYNEINKKMLNWNELLDTNLKNIFTMQKKDTGIILMQYTGLHDKNGKEIYEGDIVKAYFKKGAWKYNDKNYFGYKSGKVQYCVDGFILYIENYKEKIYPLSSFGNNNGNINELEVIGNIYDNPDLLEKGAEE